MRQARIRERTTAQSLSQEASDRARRQTCACRFISTFPHDAKVGLGRNAADFTQHNQEISTRKPRSGVDEWLWLLSICQAAETCATRLENGTQQLQSEQVKFVMNDLPRILHSKHSLTRASYHLVCSAPYHYR